MGKVPRWIVIYTILIALVAIVLSIPDIGNFGWSAAMRNMSAGIVGLAVVAFARKTPAAYFAAMVARASVEIGDVLGGITTGDNFTLIFGGVILLIDLAAIFFLFPMLSNNEPSYT